MTEDYTGRILEFPLFEGLTRSGVRLLLDPGELRELAAGDTVFREGESSTFVLLVLTGKLEVFVAREGSDLTLTHAEPGALVGELGVLCGLPRAATVRATEPATLLQWSGRTFRSLLLQDAALSERIFRRLLRTLIEKEQSLIEELGRARGPSARSQD